MVWYLFAMQWYQFGSALLEMNLSIEEKSLGFLLTILNESNDPYDHLSESDLLCLQLASVADT